MFGGFDEIFRNMDQVMNNMNQIFGQVGGRMGRPNMDPFGMMAGGPATAGMMNPFGMLDNMLMPSMQANQLMNPMSNQSQMSTMMMGGGMPGTQSYSYSSSIQYSNDGTGRPRVVERTSSAMCGANGLRETQATHRDTRTGVQEMTIGRHIRDRGHVMQKKRNAYTGELEEEDELINLEDDETPEFHQEFSQLAGQHRRGHRSHPEAIRHGHHRSHRSPQLAISAGPSSVPTTTSFARAARSSSKGPEIVEISSEPLESTSSTADVQPVVDEEDDVEVELVVTKADIVEQFEDVEEIKEEDEEEHELKMRLKKHKKNRKPYSKN